MNIDNMKRLAQALTEGLPNVTFDIGVGQRTEDDGTVSCCIAGFAALLDNNMQPFEPSPGQGGEARWQTVEEFALKSLGLTQGQGRRLFHSHPSTPQQAAQAVQNLIEGRDPWTS